MQIPENTRKVRYAVIGLGHLAQAAVLPAFENSPEAELAALVSGDEQKRRTLGQKYNVRRTYSYDEYEKCLRSGDVDAVFIILPNDQHCEYTVRAAQAGVHVLCEKPMAVTQAECEQMIQACEQNRVKLMIAYRLHLEAANLHAIEIAQSGKLGDLPNLQLGLLYAGKTREHPVKAEKGGGAVYDIGVYCINAARYIFRDEPTEVTAFGSKGFDERFQEVDEMTSALLRFPGGRLATFTSSFNGPSLQQYTVVGTKGILRVDPAFDYAQDLKHHLTRDGKTEEKAFPKRDQFAAQLTYFSQCARNDTDPEPDGWEGMADVQIVEAIYRSAETGAPVKLALRPKHTRPSLSQEIARPPIEEPEDLIKVEAPTMGE